MRHGSLFSGIGGFDLAAEWMGWENVFACEIDEWNRKLLKQNHLDTEIHGDIKQFDGTRYAGRIDVLTGGFPCQDLSIAGKGKGITGERSGLWSEMYRVIDEIRPAFVVIENSPELLKKGFEKVLYPLSEIGYDAEWGCIRASSLGAPHHRERLYVVAYPYRDRLQKILHVWKKFRGTNGEKGHRQLAGTTIQAWGAWEAEPPVLRMDDGVPDRAHRIKALGNAIVPQVAYEIFKAIEQTA